jgi:hypothetical protein
VGTAEQPPRPSGAGRDTDQPRTAESVLGWQRPAGYEQRVRPGRQYNPPTAEQEEPTGLRAALTEGLAKSRSDEACRARRAS